MLHALFLSVFLLLTAAAAAGPEDGALHIEKFADNVYLHTSYGRLSNGKLFPSNGLIVVDGEDAYVIDSPWPVADTPMLIAWAKQNGYRIRAVLASHFHDDRASGFDYLNAAGIDTVASVMTNRLLLDTGKETATSVFSKSLSLLPGAVDVFYPGPGHSPDNVVVWLPQQRILFGGCLIKSMTSRTLGNLDDALVDQWQATLATLSARFPTVRVVIPGHGEPGGPELIRHTASLVESALQQ